MRCLSAKSSHLRPVHWGGYTRAGAGGAGAEQAAFARCYRVPTAF